MHPEAPRHRSDRTVAIALAALTLVKGLFWIALMAPFTIADEPSHFQNVQYRAEYRRAPRPDGSGRPLEKVIQAGEGAPAEVRLLWSTTNRLFRNRYLPGTRAVPEEEQLGRLARDPANRRGDGQITSMDYPGFYYSLGVPAYDLFRDASLLVRLVAVRLVSMLLGIAAVVATFYSARLVMRSRELAIAAALVVLLQPMESQMTVAVNNDAGVIGLAALLFYLQLRILVRADRAPRWMLGALLGVLAGCIVFTKPHGLAMLPGCAFVCGVAIWRRPRSASTWLFVAAAAVTGVTLVVLYLWPILQTGGMLKAGGVIGAENAAAARRAPADFLSFLVGMDDKYKTYLVRSTFGQFGWLDYSLPAFWLDAIRAVFWLGAAGLVVAVATRLVRRDAAAWMHTGGLLLAVATALVAVGFGLYGEYQFRTIGAIGVLQERSFLFALPAAALAVAGSFGALVPARFRSSSAAALVTAALALHLGSILVIVRHQYGS